MTRIELDDRVAAALTEKANAEGLSLEEFLASLVQVNGTKCPAFSADEVVAMIESEASDEELSYTGTYSREDLYADHD